MRRAGKRFEITGILVAAVGLALLVGSAGFGMGMQDETDEKVAAQEQTDPPRQVDERGPDRRRRDALTNPGGRRLGQGGPRFGRSLGRRFPPGTYELKIEITRRTDSESVEVLVNGKRVGANDAAFLMRFIQKQQDARSEAVVSDLPGTPLRPEQILNVMTVIEDFDPLLYADLLALQREDDKPRFLRKIRRLALEYAREIDLKERDEEAYQYKVEDRQLENQLRELQFEIGMTQPAEQALVTEYQARVREILEERFEVQHKLRGRDLERMRNRLGWVEDEWKKRLERMDEIVDSQLANIFDELLEAGG